MKKLFISATLLFSVILSVSATEIWNGNGQGTKEAPYEIWNLDRLNEVRNFVDRQGVYFRLEKDLDLTDYLEGLSWEPIGTMEQPFKGVFLGNNHKITGLTINSTSNDQGFFGYINGATITDLTIEGQVKGAYRVGGIVGGCFDESSNTISNCTFTGSVTGTDYPVGGIAGEFSGTMSNVRHTGDVSGSQRVGGIVGFLYAGNLTDATSVGNVTAVSWYAGGVVGKSFANITDVHSTGDVKGLHCVGGLIGAEENGKSVSSSTAEGNVTGEDSTGGLIGYMEGGSVSSVSAKGIVVGTKFTGGLIGNCSASLTDARHSDGSVTGTDYVGGLTGILSNGNVTRCHVYADVTGNESVGGLVGSYEMGELFAPQIVSSGYYGNISATHFVGGILGQIHSNAREYVFMPQLHVYTTYSRSSDTVTNTYKETMTEQGNTVITISDCAAVGDIIASGSYVGGVLGEGGGGEYLTKMEHTFTPTSVDKNGISSDYYLRDGIYYRYFYYYVDGKEVKSYESSLDKRTPIPYYTYTHGTYSTILTDNYFSGNLKGVSTIGGVAGYMLGGQVQRNYSYAAIEGDNTVGGIVGFVKAENANCSGTVSCNVQLNSSITVASSDGGKIYGSATGSYLTVPTSGNTINKALNSTSLVINGIAQAVITDAQNGTPQTQRQLLQSTAYSGLGWNFNTDREWTSEEGVGYPYKHWQTAPPTIKWGAESGSASIGGSCADDGSVFVTVDGSTEVYEATCSGGIWSLNVPTLKSGTLIRAWSHSPDKEQSYHTATIAAFPGSGTEDDPWRIYDAYDLKGMAKAGHYKLMNDVDLTEWISANNSSGGWPGVGTTATGAVVFDGGGHKVTGLWCSLTTSQNGLFTYLENATIKDLTIEVAEGRQVSGLSNTAILAGQLKNGTVTNVTVKGSVSGTDNVAALIGYSEGNTISGCKVVGCSVTSTSSQSGGGGMLGMSLGDNISGCTVNAECSGSGSYIGGLAGTLKNGTMTNCTVQGKVESSGGKAHVGGLAGEVYNSKITRCYANTTVSVSGAESNVGGIAGSCSSGSAVSQCSASGTVDATGVTTNAAGLVGSTDASSPVDNCMSTVDITGTAYVGGIVGFAEGGIANSFARGSITNSSNDGRAGGIVGYIEGSSAVVKGCAGLNKRIETYSNQWGFRIIGGTGNNISRSEISDNYGWDEMPILRNNATKTVYDDPYEGEAKTTAELQQQTTYETLGWDFVETWSMDVETLFPVLKWLSQTEQPQTPDLADIADGVYYLMNVETGLFLNQGNAWGMRAVLSGRGLPVRFEKQDDGSYTITFTKRSRSMRQLFRASEEEVYVDYAGQGNGCPYWTVTNTATEGQYRIQTLVSNSIYGQSIYPGTYLGNNPIKEAKDENGNGLGVYNDVDGNVTAADGMNITWQLLPQESLFTSLQLSQMQMLVDLGTRLGVSTAEAENAMNDAGTDYEEMAEAISNMKTSILQSIGGGVDDRLLPLNLTALISNPSFVEDSSEGWEGDTPAFQSFTDAEFFQRTFDIHQTLSGLPDGTYRLQVKGFHRPGSYSDVYNDYMSGADNVSAVLYAGDGSSQRLANIARDAQEASYGYGKFVEVKYLDRVQYLPDDMQSAATCFSHGLYENELTFTVSGGMVTFGIRLDESVPSGWIIFDDFRLTLLGSSEQPQPAVEVTDISQIDNVIYIEPQEVKGGTELSLPIKMKNNAAVRSFQFDLYLPQGVSVVKSSKGRIQGKLDPERLPDEDQHQLTFSEQGDGAIRFLCGSEYDETFTGTDGVIATLQVSIAEDISEGDHAVELRNIKLSETDISRYYDTPLVSSKFTVSSFTMGDINSDGTVDVSDYTGVANHIHGNTPEGFVMKAADVDESGNVDVSDYTGVANIIHTGSVYGHSGSRSDGWGARVMKSATDVSQMDNVLYIVPFTVPASGQAELSISMKNTVDIRGFQFDLYLPEGVVPVKSEKGRIQGSLSPDRLPEDDEHDLTFSEHADGAIRFLCSSQYEETFTGTDGVIATLKISIPDNMPSGIYPVRMRNVKLTENDISKFYVTDEVESMMTIGTPALRGDVNGDGTVDVADITSVISVMAGNTAIAHSAADVNGDGSVDATDITTIISIMAGQ